ncbi:HalOD1 output domain-containing protein [Halovivax limisalsi]|uniref:HalOD1 output domain-containing protein n=1 Tax=Halovivax limisalsi TaxID=1453760 RepID=UPI0031B87653
MGVHIVSEVADREGVDPTELRPPLHDVIDPEALDALFEPTTTSQRARDGSVTFAYCGYEVTVTAAGDISIGSEPSAGERAGDRREPAIE